MKDAHGHADAIDKMARTVGQCSRASRTVSEHMSDTCIVSMELVIKMICAHAPSIDPPLWAIRENGGEEQADGGRPQYSPDNGRP
jgi:hypothetical protein